MRPESENDSAKALLKKVMRKMIAMLFITLLPLRVMAQTYSTPIQQDQALGNVFYNNHQYFQCMAKKHCGPDTGGDSYAVFIKDVHSKTVIPNFLDCQDDGSANLSMAESLIPRFNETIEGGEACFNPDQVSPDVEPGFVSKSMKAINAYQGECPKDDRSCGKQIADLFVQDVKNGISLFKAKKPAESSSTKMGCLSTLLTNLKDSLLSTLKLFLWDAPKKIFEIGKNTWNYLFNKEKDTSTSMLLTSVMSKDMADSLAKWDLAKFYSLLRKNFFNFLGNLREFYTELLGCMEWEGKPYESECLKKTNWSCPSCESVTNFMCGLGGQLGTGFMLGGMLGTAKGIMQMSQMKKAISLNPKKFGVNSDAIKEMTSRMNLDKTLKEAKLKTQTLRYRASLYTRPITDVLSSATEEIKLLSGIGKNFKKFVSLNPVTMPYHLSFQYSKRLGFNRASDRIISKFGKGSSVYLGKKYALHFSNMTDNFAIIAKDLYKIKGAKFNKVIFDDIMKRHLDDIAKESKKMGMKVERIEGGQALRLEKAGESYIYKPNLKRQMDIAENFSLEDFTKHMQAKDPMLYNSTLAASAPRMPGFIKEMHAKAAAVKDLVTVSADSVDGLLYLGHFGAQVGRSSRIEDCRDYLHDAEYLEMHKLENQ
ncbi:MAG: hypothetical protein COW01_16025 [Bdellovibrionales bacterium CG12_big_fil_rev_8_21_14_0_65_38_15]|nr:MAG: hypothetical protein COW79_15190 [Bdellovibrionales bacterium CG22_combo_CG10-13_8_21_14_all_38_13]PIQ52474.1 MAG: hypothetical protein COW01_16025 [Bdellovibrionales bacterium CG12_big_fil_rev_8_21_14_0_65_38_15]PIR29512.1 MAG: hypothetical protein COV38_10565 [Bdellovibrionales bacterium CG11_big_fil_rev_8_21_14_0_20_38_13]